MLVEGRLDPTTVKLASWFVLGLSGVLLVILCLLRASVGEALSIPALLFVLLGYLLGLGYTAPPLKLVYRGLGELVVAFTHSPFMLLAGWLVLGGGLFDPLPWLLSLPMFLSVFAAITLAGLPDVEADAAAEKKTLAVKFTNHGAVRLAQGSAVAAALSLPLLGPDIWNLFDQVAVFIGLHAIALVVLLERYRRSGAGCHRVDAILFTALSYILWFSIPPIVALW